MTHALRAYLDESGTVYTICFERLRETTSDVPSLLSVPSCSGTVHPPRCPCHTLQIPESKKTGWPALSIASASLEFALTTHVQVQYRHHSHVRWFRHLATVAKTTAGASFTTAAGCCSLLKSHPISFTPALE